MDISEIEGIELFHRVAIRRLRIAVGTDIVGGRHRREPYANTIAAAFLGDGLGDFQKQAGTVFKRAAIDVGALIGTVAQKLLDQIAIGGINLDAVEAGRKRASRRLAILRDDIGHFVSLQWTGCDARLKACFGEGLDVGTNRRRCDRQRAVRLQRRMGNPPDMPKLHEDAAAFGMHALRDRLPSLDLCLVIDPGVKA